MFKLHQKFLKLSQNRKEATALKAREVQEYNFTPNIDKNSKKMGKRYRSYNSNSPNDIYETLYQNGVSKRKTQCVGKETVMDKEALKECTFKPKLNKNRNRARNDASKSDSRS